VRALTAERGRQGTRSAQMPIEAHRRRRLFVGTVMGYEESICAAVHVWLEPAVDSMIRMIPR
jgi:hypothetical protein